MGIKLTNNANATLAASINSSATSITLTSGQGARFPTLSAGDHFYATLVDTSNNLEIVKCTARSTDVLTVVRAQESTTARAYTTGDRIEIRLTAQTFIDAVNEIGPTQVSDEINTSTGYFDLPSGTTAQRPGSPVDGMIRHNADNDTVEFYDSGSWKQVSATYPIEILLVAGGGGGSHYNSAGGGGAGGLLYYGAETPKTPNGAAISILSGSAYSITVGAGGAGGYGSYGANPTSGQNTTFSGSGVSTLTAIGGGYGSDGNNVGNPGTGGSGGGARAASAPASIGGAGTAGQGNKGGDSGDYVNNYPGGGGGGAGAAGGNGSGSTIAGAGGVGLAYSISGSSTYYAGGGGGSTQSGGTGGAGGNGGGGAGGTSTNSYIPTAGTANRGGGGGAGGYGGSTINGANGGSGVVIIRYAGGQKGSGGTVTSSGGYTIHTFTSSGTYTG